MNNSHFEDIERYLLGHMSESEKEVFLNEMTQNPELSSEVTLQKDIFRAIKSQKDIEKVRAGIKEARKRDTFLKRMKNGVFTTLIIVLVGLGYLIKSNTNRKTAPAQMEEKGLKGTDILQPESIEIDNDYDEIQKTDSKAIDSSVKEDNVDKDSKKANPQPKKAKSKNISENYLFAQVIIKRENSLRSSESSKSTLIFTPELIYATNLSDYIDEAALSDNDNKAFFILKEALEYIIKNDKENAHKKIKSVDISKLSNNSLKGLMWLYKGNLSLEMEENTFVESHLKNSIQLTENQADEIYILATNNIAIYYNLKDDIVSAKKIYDNLEKQILNTSELTILLKVKCLINAAIFYKSIGNQKKLKDLCDKSIWFLEQNNNNSKQWVNSVCN